MAYAGSRPQGRHLECPTTPRTGHASGNRANFSLAGGNCRGVADGGYNISDDDSCAFAQPTSKNDANPKLSRDGLQDNGGPTQTIAIRRGSPALNAIPEDDNGCGTEIT